MNKKLIAIALAICSSTIIATSCNNSNNQNQVININNTKKIENIIHEKLKEDIDEKKDISVIDLDGDGEEEYIVKYRIEVEESPLRIMILSEQDENLIIQDEIKNVGEDFDRIEYIDINNDGRLEILAGFKVGDNLSKGMSIYEYKEGKVTEIFEEYYSEYMVRDINNDGNKEIVIIKEKEKEDKSYAYLYKWQEGIFENVKKVEIDSTLDTEDEIFKKLLEK